MSKTVKAAGAGSEIVPAQTYVALRDAITDLIQESMPWPFSDVSRYDAEGRESAAAIAAACLPVIVREFNDLRSAGRRKR